MLKTFLALALTSSLAHASVIKVETATATSNVLSSAAAYRSAVDQALTGATYKTATVADYTAVTHRSLFGGNGTNFAWKSTITFNVASAATYGFRIGVDFGQGGALFLDGAAVDLKNADIYWGGTYSNPAQYLLASSFLNVGTHVLNFYGFEQCCDGAQQAQFNRAGGTYQTFRAADGMTPPVAVPEPGTLAVLGAGLGLMALARRRRSTRVKPA